MKSSRSRSRKSRTVRPTGGNIINRVFDSSGPEGKVRGTPQQIIDKYNQLHRDAVLSGDRVNAENFAQHAEHYTRLLAEAQREVDQRREEQERQNRERQAERDRERTDRLKAQEDSAQSGPSSQPDQPAASGLHSDEAETPAEPPQQTGLVETPEEAPKPRRPRRKPRGEGGSDAGGNKSSDRNGPAEAAE